jgi:hypothetical protein
MRIRLFTLARSVWRGFVRGGSAIGRFEVWAITAVCRWLAAEFGRDELYLFGGLALLGIGSWELGVTVHPAFKAAAFIVPGAAFVWLSLPTRAPFFEPPALDPKRRGD